MTKLQAQKSLTSLMEKGEIVGKMYGKTWVFCAKQVSPWLDLRIGVGGVVGILGCCEGVGVSKLVV